VTRLLAWANGLGFLAIGLCFAVFAEPAARGLGITFSDAVGLGDFRAVYGGVQMALGASILFFVVRNSFREALMIGLFAVTGLASLRILSMVIDAAADPVQWRLLALEVLGGAVNVLG
jgi:hypothetical protein